MANGTIIFISILDVSIVSSFTFCRGPNGRKSSSLLKSKELSLNVISYRDPLSLSEWKIPSVVQNANKKVNSMPLSEKYKLKADLFLLHFCVNRV